MPMPEGIKAIDAFINMNPPKGWTQSKTQAMYKDKESKDTGASPLSYMFGGSITDRMGSGASPDEMVQQMDEAGIEKGLLSINTAEPDDIAFAAIEQHPDRFVGACFVDPHEGMEAVRKLERMVKDYGCKAAKVAAYRIQKPYNDRIYYPIYAKCVELDVPITAQVGIPVPRVPGEVQNPMYLDEVCWFFPELKVVMTHVGEPWQFACVKLMLKWPNLYYMTSAFAPKYYPQEIITYMNSRGTDKVMFATDYPILPFDRCMREVKDLPLRDNVWEKFLRENTISVFKL